LFVPIYHRLRLTSAYEYLELRFDRRLRRAGSLLFGLYTVAWLGSMLYATGLIVQAALGLSEWQAVAAMGVLGAVTAGDTAAGGVDERAQVGGAGRRRPRRAAAGRRPRRGRLAKCLAPGAGARQVRPVRHALRPHQPGHVLLGVRLRDVRLPVGRRHGAGGGA